MGFRMTDSPFLHTPQRLDTDVDGFHFIRLYDPSRARLAIQRWRPRPSPLAILRERLFLNSGSN